MLSAQEASAQCPVTGGGARLGEKEGRAADCLEPETLKCILFPFRLGLVVKTTEGKRPCVLSGSTTDGGLPNRMYIPTSVQPRTQRKWRVDTYRNDIPPDHIKCPQKPLCVVKPPTRSYLIPPSTLVRGQTSERATDTRWTQTS